MVNSLKHIIGHVRMVSYLSHTALKQTSHRQLGRTLCTFILLLTDKCCFKNQLKRKNDGRKVSGTKGKDQSEVGYIKKQTIY